MKKPDMPPAAILAEIRPGGALRPSIADLAEKSGAYIIVSSGADLSDTMLKARRDKMREAVKGENNAASLVLDFYDRSRVASWARSHPGVIPWARSQAGRAIRGWHSYEAWAYSPDGLSGAYLLDDAVRIHAGNRDAKGASAANGITQLREALAQPRGVVPSLGFQGSAKTRLVRVGESSLDPALANL